MVAVPEAAPVVDFVVHQTYAASSSANFASCIDSSAVVYASFTDSFVVEPAWSGGLVAFN